MGYSDLLKVELSGTKFVQITPLTFKIKLLNKSIEK